MKQLKSISTAVATLSMALLFTASVPAFAQHGAGDAGGIARAEHQSAEVASHVAKTDGQQPAGEQKEVTLAEHQKRCEAHKQGLTNKFSHIVTNSQRIQDRITGVLTKAQAYQTAHNLPVANFDSLVSTAQAAGATSAASITSLKAVTPSLDCNNVSVASDVATFKTAAKTTRDDLKAYRTAVKAVLQALEAAKPDTEGSSTQ